MGLLLVKIDQVVKVALVLFHFFVRKGGLLGYLRLQGIGLPLEEEDFELGAAWVDLLFDFDELCVEPFELFDPLFVFLPEAGYELVDLRCSVLKFDPLPRFFQAFLIFKAIHSSVITDEKLRIVLVAI